MSEYLGKIQLYHISTTSTNTEVLGNPSELTHDLTTVKVHLNEFLSNMAYL